MKRLLCLFSALLMLLLCVTAQAERADYLASVFSYPQAEPRYPAVSLPVTDAAAVLGMQTVEDLRSFSSLLVKETKDSVRLTVVTVDFLDGASGQDYARALAERSGMEHGILLLMVVGEDTYHVAFTDRSVPVSDAAVTKLLTQYFEPLFLAQRYDDAIAAFIPAFAQEVSKACSCRLSAEGLFGVKAAPAAAASAFAGNQRTNLSWDPNAWTRQLDNLNQTRQNTGIGLGGTLLIVFLLFRFLGRRRRGRRHSFLTILAGFGLFSMIRNIFRRGR